MGLKVQKGNKQLIEIAPVTREVIVFDWVEIADQPLEGAGTPSGDRQQGPFAKKNEKEKREWKQIKRRKVAI